MAKLNRKSKLIFLVIFASIIAAIWFVSSSDKKEENSGEQIVKPTIGSIEQTVTAQGKLEAKDYVDVGAQVSGQLKVLHVEIGDIVKKGDLIAEIDPKVYESRVEADMAQIKTLQAQLGQAQAQAVLAGQTYQRNQKLIAQDAISKEEMEQSESEYRVALSQIKSVEAQIQQQNSTLKGDQANLSYTKIYAPMDGTVTTNPTRQGQTVNANQQAPVIVQVANLDVMTVRAQVAEADVMSLTPDMEVYFTTLGAPDTKWKGAIRQILPTPEVINDVVLYNALIDVDNKDRQLMTGMSTQVFFVKGSAKNVLTIPVTALRKPTGENTYMVKTPTGEKQVTVGLQDRNIAEIKAGLTANDEVITYSKPAKKSGQGGGGMRGMAGVPRI